MANNYKVKNFSNSTTNTSQVLFEASASTTLVKSIIVNCDKATPNATATLKLKKSGGSEELIKRVTVTSQDVSTELLYDVLPLEAGDELYATSSDTDLNFMMSWVENTNVAIGTAINALSDVDTTGVADGDVLTYNSTSGNWEAEAPAAGGDIFKTIAVAGQSDVVADSATDTLTFAVGGGMTITTNATTDTITFDSANLDNDDVTLQGARQIELNGETLTIFDGSGDVAVWSSDTSLLYNLEVSSQDAGNGAAVKLYEASNNGTNYVTVGVNSTLASDVTFTLPTSNGTNGYVLQTDGSGNTSWVAASGGASYSAVRTQSGTSYTLVIGDAGDYIQTTSTTAVTITVPPQSSVAWAADTEIYFEQNNTGQITIAAGSGVTINSSETLKSFARYSVIALKRVASDVWTLTGERALV